MLHHTFPKGMAITSFRGDELGPLREPIRNIVGMLGLKNLTHQCKLAWKIEVLIFPKTNFPFQPLKASIPYRNKRKTDSKWNTKISHYKTRLNKPPRGWNLCK